METITRHFPRRTPAIPPMFRGGYMPPRIHRSPAVSEWLQLRAAEKRARKALLALERAAHANQHDADRHEAACRDAFAADGEAADILETFEKALGWPATRDHEHMPRRYRTKAWRRERGLM